MANVQVIQRHAHLAAAVKLEFVNGREGRIAKAVLTAISNTRRGSGDNREEESTAIQWTLWGKQAENAAEYLAAPGTDFQVQAAIVHAARHALGAGRTAPCGRLTYGT